MEFNNNMEFNTESGNAERPVEDSYEKADSSVQNEFDESVVDHEFFETVKNNSLEKDLNSFVKFEFNDGSSTYLACTFLRIYKLKSVNPGFYKRYNHILMNGAEEVTDIVTRLYGAYLCAHINTLDKCMSEEEFMAKVPYDFKYLGDVNTQLAAKKKN